MSLRIPINGQTAQVEFHEIERRLRRLERATGTSQGVGSRVTVIGSSGGGTVNLTSILARLDALEDAIANLPPPVTYQDFGGVGATSRRGLVPAPGTASPPAGVSQHLLTEDGEWGFPFRGLMDVTTSGETEAADALDVLGGLAILGNLSANDGSLAGLAVHGDIECSDISLFSINGAPERGLIQVATEANQTEYPFDVVDINAALHVAGPVSLGDLVCSDLYVTGDLTLDGGGPF